MDICKFNGLFSLPICMFENFHDKKSKIENPSKIVLDPFPKVSLK